MDSDKNRYYQTGFTLCLLSGGLMFMEDMFDLGLAFTIFYGAIALIGFYLLMKGVKVID